MADGKTHFAANVIAGLAMTGAAAYYAPELVGPVAAGSVIGAFITPDMDLESKTHSEALLRQVPVLGLAFQFFWYPYAVLHRHRGVSHWPVIGTLGRLAYMLVVAALIGVFAVGWTALVGNDLPTLTLPAIDWSFWFWLLAAWAAQDLTHIALDAVGKG